MTLYARGSRNNGKLVASNGFERRNREVHQVDNGGRELEFTVRRNLRSPRDVGTTSGVGIPRIELNYYVLQGIPWIRNGSFIHDTVNIYDFNLFALTFS